jgi:hypothetical protein
VIHKIMVHRRADASSKKDSTIVDSAIHGADDAKDIKIATLGRVGRFVGISLVCRVVYSVDVIQWHQMRQLLHY